MNSFRSEFLSGNRKSKIANRKLVGLIILALAFTLCAAVADAQQAGKIFRIGFLDTGTASGMAVLVDAFRQELNKLGWIEGKNVTIAFRFNENRGVQFLPELAADLVRLKVDLIVATAGPAAVGSRKRTTTNTLRCGTTARPRGGGPGGSRARPGGHRSLLSSLFRRPESL